MLSTWGFHDTSTAGRQSSVFEGTNCSFRQEWPWLQEKQFVGLVQNRLHTQCTDDFTVELRRVCVLGTLPWESSGAVFWHMQPTQVSLAELLLQGSSWGNFDLSFLIYNFICKFQTLEDSFPEWLQEIL